MSKQEYQKKASLLRQKIMTNAAITHNNYQHSIEQLQQSEQQAKELLAKSASSFANRVRQMGEQYRQEMNRLWAYCNQQEAAESSPFAEAVPAEQLKLYLNAEKAALKQLMDLEQGADQEGTKLQELAKLRNLQSLLQEVQFGGLESEIKYLSTHVINSSGLIYTPESTVTEADEQEVQRKIEIQLKELERLVNLQVIGDSKDRPDSRETNLSAILNCLGQQEARLKQAEKLLSAEQESIRQKERAISAYLDLARDCPTYAGPAQGARVVKGSNWPLAEVAEEELGLILNGLNLEDYSDIICNKNCQHEEIGDRLRAIRNRLKKLE